MGRGVERRLCGSFLSHLPPLGKAGPTLPKTPCVFPSEELEVLSLVHIRHYLPDTNMWIFKTCEPERTSGFSAAIS